MGVMYKLTSPSGKSYIGITTGSFEARWWKHQNNAKHGRETRSGRECGHLYAAIRKYGGASFATEILAFEGDWKALCRMEVEAIASHGTLSPAGYNLTTGGEGSPGVKLDRITRVAMSAAQKRRLENPDELAAVKGYLAVAVKSRAEKWHAKSAEEKEAWGKLHGERVRAGKAKPESKEREIAAARLRAQNPETRKKIAATLTGRKGKPWTDEQKAAAAEKRRREWADPVMRAKRLAGFKAARLKRSTGDGTQKGDVK